MPKKRQRRNPVPKAPPKRRFAGQPVPERQLTSALQRVRAMSGQLDERERAFDPSRAPTWRGSSRDLVVNGSMDEFTRGFLETALWSSNDESDDSGGEPLDANYSIEDFDPKSLEGLERDCERFQSENADDLAVCYETGIRGQSDEFSAGHDFWLTRCGHGAGFWDGDYPEPQATRLSEASENFGNVDLYVGDDGQIYASGYESGTDKNYRRNAEQLSFKGMGVGPHAAGGIELREFDWEQVDGDVNLCAHGGIIARSNGKEIDLIEIQPVREYVGDGEAAEVGFPFWTKEAYYDLSDLSPSNKNVKAAMESSDLDLSEIDPEHRGVAIALACMRYGHGSEEGDGGWSKDIVQFPVRWGYAGTERMTFEEYCGDEDEEFRVEVLGEGYTYKIAYEIITPESAEDGEAEERGWEEEGSDIASLADTIRAASDHNWIEWSDSNIGPGSWLISEEEQDMHTGASTVYSLWIERSDKEPLNKDEILEINKAFGISNFGRMLPNRRKRSR
ncbi:MAG TPA: hypothetical protein VNN25_18600 [Thermoanaerobaculia bacterium]|nr:hypothetical protein [Thermoanaerobaculia bacterium]HXI98136.1 hypothetical protein [Gemmatimonadaceae bacterium]